MSAEILIVTQGADGVRLADAVAGAGLRARVVEPGAMPLATSEGTAAVILDARAYADRLALAQAVREVTGRGVPHLVVDGALGADRVAELEAMVRSRPPPIGTEPPGLDLARRIDEAVGEAMADLVGTLVGEVAPTAPALEEPPLESTPLESTAARAAVNVGKPARTAADPSEPDLRQRMLDLHALVQEGDYFQILGIGREATAADVRRAYLERCEVLALERLSPALRAELGHRLEEIEQVLDEARAVLQDDDLRHAYRTNLRD